MPKSKVRVLTHPIKDDDRKVFEAIRDPSYHNFALMSVTYGNEKTVAIVAINRTPDRNFLMEPIYIKPTRSMMKKLCDPDGKHLSR